MNNIAKAKALLQGNHINNKADKQLEEMDKIQSDKKELLADFCELYMKYYRLTGNRDFVSQDYKVKMRRNLWFDEWKKIRCRTKNKHLLSLDFYPFDRQNYHTNKIKLCENWSKYIVGLIYNIQAAIAAAIADNKAAIKKGQSELESIQSALP